MEKWLISREKLLLELVRRKEKKQENEISEVGDVVEVRSRDQTSEAKICRWPVELSRQVLHRVWFWFCLKGFG
jgi:hypothetical protein